MVFTLNTSVWAVEIGDDEATVDAIVTEDSDAAVETADIDSYADLAADEDPNKALEAAGWKATYEVKKGKEDKVGIKAFKDGKITLSSDAVMSSLVGNTDNSAAITIDAPASFNGTEYITESANLIYGLKVDAGINPNGSVVVTLLSNNKITSTSMTGYAYIGTGPDGETKNQIKSDADVKAWAEAACGTDVTVAVDDSSKKEKIVLTFSYDVKSVQEKNQPYGKTTLSESNMTFVYNQFVPFPGKKTLKGSAIDSFLGLSLSSNGQTYKIEKAKLSHKKKDGNKATIIVKKVTGSDKKTAKKLKEDINKKKIQVTVYALNLSFGGYDNAKLSKKGNKFSAKVNGKKYTVKDGKDDGWGGTAKITTSGNKATVSGSNIFTGTMK